MERKMKDKFKCNFKKERSNEVELVASNLEAILKSSTYKLAHEDIDLLNTDEMRGVRMLLEITKPEQVIEKENIIYDWRLNERHYGALQGLNKSETAKKYGEDQVKVWRRSFDIPPPFLSNSDERHPKFEKCFKFELNLKQFII